MYMLLRKEKKTFYNIKEPHFENRFSLDSFLKSFCLQVGTASKGSFFFHFWTTKADFLGQKFVTHSVTSHRTIVVCSSVQKLVYKKNAKTFGIFRRKFLIFPPYIFVRTDVQSVLPYRYCIR